MTRLAFAAMVICLGMGGFAPAQAGAAQTQEPAAPMTSTSIPALAGRGGKGEGVVPLAIGSDRARYRLTDCRSIIDTTTQLEWYVGPDFNMTWYDANKWAHGLGNCRGSWAMPSIDELKALFDPAYVAGTGYYTRERYWPAHIDPIFSQIGQGSWVWARGAPDTRGAPALNFNQGIAVRISPTNGEFTVRVFAVRPASDNGNPLMPKREDFSPPPSTQSGGGVFVNPARER